MCSDRNKKKPDTGQKKTYYTTDKFFGVAISPNSVHMSIFKWLLNTASRHDDYNIHLCFKSGFKHIVLHSKKWRVDSTRSAVGFVCRKACRFYTPACD
jgi:hypothetical protein